MDLSLEDPIVQFTVYHKALQYNEQSLQNFFQRIMNTWLLSEYNNSLQYKEHVLIIMAIIFFS